MRTQLANTASDKINERRDTRPLTHLERIEAGDNSAVFHLAALGRVGELALAVRPGARPPLELSADLQRQPLCVADLRHVHCHVAAGGCGELTGRRGGVREERRLSLRPSVCDDCGTGGETGWAKDMGNVWSEDVSSEAFLFFGWFTGRRPRWRWPTTCGSSWRFRRVEASPPLHCEVRPTAVGVYRSGRTMMRKGAWGEGLHRGEETEEGTGAPTPPPLLFTAADESRPSSEDGGAADFA